MPIPPGFLSRHPADAGTHDDRVGTIYRDPSAPDGVAAYYVILSLSPKKVLRVEIPAEDLDMETRRVIEGARDLLVGRRRQEARAELRLIG